MLAPLLLLTAFVGPDGLSTEAPDPATIVNGTPAQSCEWPSVVSMLEDDATPSMCSGTLVHTNVVMTAAHCIVDDRPIVAVGFGEHSEQSGVPEREVAVVDCVQHPNYSLEAWPDIGYCTLAAPVTDIQIVPVMAGCETEALQIGTQVQIIGYGSTYGEVIDGETQAQGVGTKRYTTQYVDDLSFEEAYTALAWNTGSQSACFGDSGGPAMAQLADGTWRVFGIGAHLYDPGDLPPPEEPGNVCGPGAVYTWATAEVGWLEQSSGFDVTPCWNGDVWEPGPGCGLVPQMPDVGEGSWLGGCQGMLSGFDQPSCDAIDPPPIPPPPPTPPFPGDTGSDDGFDTGLDDGFDTGLDDGVPPNPPPPSPPSPPSTTGTSPPPPPLDDEGGSDETGGELLVNDGLADRGCACRATSSRSPAPWALLASILLLVRRRPR